MLKFIGTGDLVNVELGNTSAYIKEDDSLLIIDCGVTAFKRIIQLNILEDVKHLYIAITHNHPDHLSGLASLIYYTYYWKDIETNIIVSGNDNNSQRDDLKLFLFLQGLSDDKYNIIYDNEISLFNNNLTLNFKPIVHTKNLNSFAINIVYNDRRIFYLGDNYDKEYIINLINDILPEDIIYTDCTSYEYKNKVHMELACLVDIVPEKYRKQVVCMHFCNEQNLSEIEQYGFKVAKNELTKKEILDKIKSH